MKTLGSMKNKDPLKLLLYFALMINSSAVFSQVRAFLSQDTYYEGDPITLTLETNTNTSAKPDLSVLQQNFDILGTSTNSQINIINGRRSFKKSWIVELQPKIKGKLQIPSLSVGQEKTSPIELTITDLPPEVRAETGKHISIEATVGLDADKKTYVQQQIPYTVKIYYDASMQSAEVNTLQIENAVIEQLGRDKKYKIVRGGKKLNVIEKNYVISPEKSGKLHIPATTIKGRIALSGGDSPQLRRRMDETDMLNKFFSDFRNDPFFSDSFGGGFFSNRSLAPSKPFTASSNAIEVEVLPVPDAFTGSNWLPAEELSIDDSWSKNPPDFKVGEPVTRTLILQAKGLAGSQIPDIAIPKTAGVKTYTDPAKTETRTDGKTVYGIQQLDITYIPNEAGKIVIPEIKVDWWNVKTEQQKTFVLPEWHLNAAVGLQSASPEYEAEPKVEKQKIAEKNTTVSQDKKILPENKWADFSWIDTILSLLTLAVIGLLIYFFRKNSTKKASNPRAKKNIKNEVKQINASLLKACDNNDKYLAAEQLIKLIQLSWSDESIQSLGFIAKNLTSGADVIRDLEQKLYAKGQSDWSGAELKKLLNEGLKRQSIDSTRIDEGALKPLYPN